MFSKAFLVLGASIALSAPLQGSIEVNNLTTYPNNRLTPVLNAIKSATSTLDIVMYDFSDPTLALAVVEAQLSGVTVRVILNQTFAPGAVPGGSSFNAVTKAFLEGYGVQVHYGNPIFQYTHEKAMVIDSAIPSLAKAFVMTLNFEVAGFIGVRDFAIFVTSADDVAEIEEVFNADWNLTTASVSQPNLVWSPENSLTKLTALINASLHTMDIYMELLGDPTITAAIIAAVNRGVYVRIIISAPLNLNVFGQAFDFAYWNGDFHSATVRQLQEGGVDFRFLSLPYIHAKTILVDYQTPYAQLFLGSENLYTGSLLNNRELGILTTDTAAMDGVETAFMYDWNIARGF